MTLLVSDHASPWHRTLPNPAALLPNPVFEPYAHKGSSLLQHHVVKAHAAATSRTDCQRRSTAPCLSVQQGPKSSLDRGQDHGLDATSSSSDICIGGGETMKKQSVTVIPDDDPSTATEPPTTSPVEASHYFCLCQPDPKIPRPRNAFILYRQHQQVNVVAQNPGLPNPEISKIIGEQWRQLPAKSKGEWKALAEEEKARHSQQYPDYRYQPRRTGRSSSQSSISGPSSATVRPQGNCVKCGGKTMNPPTTPYTAFVPVTPGTAPPLVTATRPQRSYTMTEAQNQRPHPARPMVSPPHSARRRDYGEVFGQSPRQAPRLRYAVAQPRPNPASSTSAIDSPEAKRRRVNGPAMYTPTREMYPEAQYQYSPQAITLSRSDLAAMTRPGMPPPVRPLYNQAVPQPQPAIHFHPLRPPHMQHKRDPSLTLPPLKTSAVQLATKSSAQSQKSSLAAMIMSIPVLNKVKILAQISPQLAAPGISSPPHVVRGAIIAVEGMDRKSIHSMTASLAHQLEKNGKFAVRIYGGPEPPIVDQEVTQGNGRGDASTLTAAGVLEIISEWHQISREMVEYITTPPEPSCSPSTERPLQPSSGSAVVPGALDDSRSCKPTHTSGRAFSQFEGMGATKSTGITTRVTTPISAVSPRTISQPVQPTPVTPPTMSNALAQHSATEVPPRRSRIPPLPPAAVQTPSTTLHTQASSLPTEAAPSGTTKTEIVPIQEPIPIALVPHYQLTTVDASAISMPITDAYSPHSHWQWLATLWRGCVGPDVTVVIKGTETWDDDAAGGNDSGGEPSTPADKSVPAGVEVRLLDCRAVVVRTNVKFESSEVGAEAGAGTAEGETWDKAKRRVAFEVEEYLRK